MERGQNCFKPVKNMKNMVIMLLKEVRISLVIISLNWVKLVKIS